MIQCYQCKFWVGYKGEDSNLGECRIKPPVIVGELAMANRSTLLGLTKFPVTYPTACCGEGRRKNPCEKGDYDPLGS